MDLDVLPAASADAHFNELDIGSHEFTEDDVLPFLLQAQDIIAKLESRVIELETDLSTIHRKYEHDRQDWLVGLSQKDQFIHYLTSKLQKLEFNSKEAIVLLSDMDSDHPSVSLCLDYLRHAQQTTMPVMNVAPEESTHVIEDLEEGELERRQAEWNRQRKLDANDAGLSLFKSSVNLMVGVVGSPETSDTTSSSSSQLADDPSETEGVAQNTTADAPSKHASSPLVTPHRSIPLSVDTAHQTFCANCRQLLAQLDQQIEQKAYLKRDLGSLAAALTEEGKRRDHIERVKEEFEEDVEEIASSLFASLNEILMDEVTNRDGLVRLNREMDNRLSTVLAAWDVREQRLKQIKEYLVELDKAVHQSSSLTAALPRAGDVVTGEDAWLAGTASAATTAGGQARVRTSALHRTSSSGRSSFSVHTLGPLDESGTTSSRAIRVDGLVFDEFRQHLKALTASPQIAIPSTSFMKRVLSDDIDPCLFQNTGSSWWKSPWFKRKLMDAIAKNRCEIQPHHTESTSFFSSCSSTSSPSPTASHISTASSTTTQAPMPPKTKCTCCGLLRVCEFRMRLHASQTPAPPHKQHASPTSAQPWLPIDRFCRDRLVAVCDFYSFMTHVRQGLQQHVPVLNLFRQCLNWRRRMALAKIGSKALFDDSGRYSYLSSRRRSQSSRGESTVYDHSGSSSNSSDSSSVVSVSDIQGLDGTHQIVIVH